MASERAQEAALALAEARQALCNGRSALGHVLAGLAKIGLNKTRCRHVCLIFFL